MDGLVRIGMEGFSKEEDSLFITAEGAIHHRSLDINVQGLGQGSLQGKDHRYCSEMDASNGF